MTALEVAKNRLAECEALIEQGLGGPYAEQNLASHKARVARLSAEAPAPAAVTYTPSPAPVRSTPTPARAKPLGTREQRLRRLAAAWGADEATLNAAIADGTTPDAFALIVSDEAQIRAVAERIAAA